MRVSVTDRCDLRCRYCMPEGCEKIPMSHILTYEEIIKICSCAADLGISRIKITGGEPFVRLGCTNLIRQIKALDGIDEVTITTNGQQLASHIEELKDIGIDGINISLDTVDPDRYRYITGRGDLSKVLQAIDLAAESGIKTKVNCLLQRGFNEDEILGITDLAFEKGIYVRFIEMMPIGVGDPASGIPNTEVMAKLMERWPDLKPDTDVHGNGPAIYYRRPGINGGIGLISAIHGKFCASCNRIRLTSQGQIKPCLCFDEGTDLKPYLSGPDELLKDALRKAILSKPAEHCFTEKVHGSEEHRLMAQIGG